MPCSHYYQDKVVYLETGKYAVREYLHNQYGSGSKASLDGELKDTGPHGDDLDDQFSLIV